MSWLWESRSFPSYFVGISFAFAVWFRGFRIPVGLLSALEYDGAKRRKGSKTDRGVDMRGAFHGLSLLFHHDAL